MGFVNEVDEKFEGRTIDYQRNIILKLENSGLGDSMCRFKLTIKNDCLFFKANGNSELLEKEKK